jgi:hypothetical protein
MGTDETMEEALNRLINSFSLAVGFGVLSRAHAKLCSRCLEHGLPELACEDRIFVGNQDPGKTVQLVHIVNENFRHLRSCVRVSQRNEMGIFGELVHHHKDAIKAS